MALFKIHVDGTYDTEADAMYIRVDQGDEKPVSTTPLNSFMMADLGKNGDIIGIEILQYSKVSKLLKKKK